MSRMFLTKYQEKREMEKGEDVSTIAPNLYVNSPYQFYSLLRPSNNFLTLTYHCYSFPISRSLLGINTKRETAPKFFF